MNNNARPLRSVYCPVRFISRASLKAILTRTHSPRRFALAEPAASVEEEEDEVDGLGHESSASETEEQVGPKKSRLRSRVCEAICTPVLHTPYLCTPYQHVYLYSFACICVRTSI